jgi:DedD protein
MPPADTIDQELLLKKRARRRLVGALTLVMLLIIVLPIILKDRVSATNNDQAKIVMNADALSQTVSPRFEADTESATAEVVIDATPTFAKPGLDDATLIDADKQAVEVIKPTQSDSVQQKKTEKVTLQQEKAAELAPTKVPIEVKPMSDVKQSAIAVKPTNNPTLLPEVNNAQSAFSIQVGVFSDLNNMKNTQSALTKAGFTTNTEKLLTPKGESIRLMAGSYSSRELANDALSKIKSIGLDGMIKSTLRTDQSKVN